MCAAIERRRNKEVAFRVIVACHAGLGTSKLLLEKLRRHFRFRIVDVISAHEASRINPLTADIVISTVPLENCPIEYIVVSAIFNDADYIRVGNRIDALRSNRNIPAAIDEDLLSVKVLIEKIRPLAEEYVEDPEKYRSFMKELRKVLRTCFKQNDQAKSEVISPYLHHLLTPRYLQLDVECHDWREAVVKSAARLLEDGYIEKSYVNAMLYSVEEYGPYIILAPGFAMPHAKVEEGSIRQGMNMIRLKEPVNFGVAELDPIEFVCCLSAVDHKSYLKAFFNLVNLMRDEAFKEQLRAAASPEEMAHIIEKYEYGIM